MGEATTMEILINGRAGLVGAQGGSDLAAVIADLRKYLAAQAMAATRLTLDGAELGAQAERDRGPDRVETHARLEVEAVGIHALALSILAGSRELLPAVADSFTRAAGVITAGQVGQALARLEGALEACQMLLGSFDGMRRLFSIDLAAIEVDGETLQARAERLALLLGQIEVALKSADLVTLSDLLEYELAPALAAWHAATWALEQVVREDARGKGIELA